MQKVKKQTKKRIVSKKGKLPSVLVELIQKFEDAFGKNSNIKPAN